MFAIVFVFILFFIAFLNPPLLLLCYSICLFPRPHTHCLSPERNHESPARLNPTWNLSYCPDSHRPLDTHLSTHGACALFFGDLTANIPPHPQQEQPLFPFPKNFLLCYWKRNPDETVSLPLGLKNRVGGKSDHLAKTFFFLTDSLYCLKIASLPCFLLAFSFSLTTCYSCFYLFSFLLFFCFICLPLGRCLGLIPLTEWFGHLPSVNRGLSKPIEQIFPPCGLSNYRNTP